MDEDTWEKLMSNVAALDKSVHGLLAERDRLRQQNAALREALTRAIRKMEDGRPPEGGTTWLEIQYALDVLVRMEAQP